MLLLIAMIKPVCITLKLCLVIGNRVLSCCQAIAWTRNDLLSIILRRTKWNLNQNTFHTRKCIWKWWQICWCLSVLSHDKKVISCVAFQIEDLSQQAQVRAVDQFKNPETALGGGEAPSTTQPPIQEESEEEEEVGRGTGISNYMSLFNMGCNYSSMR